MGVAAGVGGPAVSAATLMAAAGLKLAPAFGVGAEARASARTKPTEKLIIPMIKIASPVARHMSEPVRRRFVNVL